VEKHRPLQFCQMDNYCFNPETICAKLILLKKTFNFACDFMVGFITLELVISNSDMIGLPPKRLKFVIAH
jgi:hypothetical protein